MSGQRISLALALACALMVGACTSGSSTGLSPDPVGGPDATVALGDATTPNLTDLGWTVSDDAATPPGDIAQRTPDVPDDEPCEGCFGAPCDENDDCFSGWCIDGPDGNVCTEDCTSECPSGYSCRSIAGTGGDPIFLCIYDHVTYCQPCTEVADCAHPLVTGAGNLCLESAPEVGSFCATPCSLEGACPDGGVCQTVDGADVCVPGEGECTCSSRAILDGASTTCALVNDFGSCGGTRTCEAEGLTACDAIEPAIESCNDLDDDCDGLVDEDFAGKGESCDGEDVDVCLDGVLVCGDGGLVCDDDEAAATETCNDEDDDCDGLVDEDFGDKGEACDGNDADLCEDGIWACENLALVCQDGEESGDDICNGLDDDCDDKVDEGFPTVGEPCDGPDSDLCLKGTFSCTADGSAVECVNEAVVDILDTCDGVDNDCNPGTVDGFHDAGFAAPCDGADSDLCAEGILVCDGVSLALVCTDDSADSLDLCDGQDNDCDPGTPDGSAEATFEAPCDGADSDQCEEGILACDGTALVCTDDDGENDVEACNELDDDCNGIIDDKDSDTDQHVDVACTAYDGGLPADDCEDGNPAIHGGVDEVADGIDNNCNGKVDEGTEFFDDDGDCFCETGPCTGSNSKGCNNVSPGDCNDGDNTVNPAAVDHPDPDHGDQNCDGVDGDLGDSVFLSPSAGLDINNGVTPDSPVQTLNVAYAVAAAASRGWILIEGTGSLSLAGSFMEGVNLAAGYQSGSDWQNRTSADGPTVSVSASGTVISGWSTPTQWQQMVIEAGDAQGTSASSIALRVHDTQALSFIDCTFIAGDATGGGGGASGANGTFGGTKGSNGGNGCEDSGGIFCSNCSKPSGGNGGAGCDGNSGGKGGAPGKGTGSSSSGNSGTGPGGTGGAAVGHDVDGLVGGDGADGANGDNGAGGELGAFGYSGYQPVHGTSGAEGQNGGGGGGGAGGGGGNSACDSYGGGGGGGNGGACGGTGGFGGTSGGASVALLLVQSSVELVDCTLKTGSGGSGGAGGSGGTGAIAPSLRSNGGNGEDDSGKGGKGGLGGDGGNGGDGGGGAGGSTYGIVCSGFDTNLEQTNSTFELGTPGAEGVSFGPNGASGQKSNTNGC